MNDIRSALKKARTKQKGICYKVLTWISLRLIDLAYWLSTDQVTELGRLQMANINLHDDLNKAREAIQKKQGEIAWLESQVKELQADYIFHLNPTIKQEF